MLPWFLSLRPKEGMTLVTSWVRGSRSMLESPIIRMGLIKGSVHLSYLLPPCSCLWERVVSLIGVFSGLSCIDMSSCLCTVGCGVTGLAPMSKSMGHLRHTDGIRVRGVFVFLGKKGCQGCFRGLFWPADSLELFLLVFFCLFNCREFYVRDIFLTSI